MEFSSAVSEYGKRNTSLLGNRLKKRPKLAAKLVRKIGGLFWPEV